MKKRTHEMDLWKHLRGSRDTVRSDCFKKVAIDAFSGTSLSRLPSPHLSFAAAPPFSAPVPPAAKRSSPASPPPAAAPMPLQLPSGIEVEIGEAFRRLPDPRGCTWDPSLMCLSGTRISQLNELTTWAVAIPDPKVQHAEVTLVADALGSGKTALMHTVCQHICREGHLVACFFFSRMDRQSTASHFMGVLIRGLCAINKPIKRRVGELLLQDACLANASPEEQWERLILPILSLLPPGRPFVVGIDALDEERSGSLLTILQKDVPLLPRTFRFIVTTRPLKQIMKELRNQGHIRRTTWSLTGATCRQDLEKYVESRLARSDFDRPISPKMVADLVSKTEGVFLWITTVLNHVELSFDPYDELETIIYGKSEHWQENEEGTVALDNIFTRILSKLKWTDPNFVELFTKVVGALVTLKQPLSSNGLASLLGIPVAEVHKICKDVWPLLQNYHPNRSKQPIRLVHLCVKEFLTDRAPAPYRLDCQQHHKKLSKLALRVIKSDLNHHSLPLLGYTEGDWDIHNIPNIPSVPKEIISEHLWYATRFVVDHTVEAAYDQVGATHMALIREVIFAKARMLLEATASLGTVIDMAPLRKWFTDSPNRNQALDLPALQEFAKSLYDISSCLEDAGRGGEALPAAREAASIRRQLATVDSSTLAQNTLSLSLRLVSKCLMARKQYQDALDSIKEAESISRRMAQVNSTEFQLRLVQILRWKAKVLIALNLPHDAIRVCGEAVEICRSLSAANTAEVKSELGYTLFAQAWHLSECQRYPEGVGLLGEAIDIFRGLVKDDFGRFIEDLANALYNRGFYLADMDRPEDSLKPIEEAVSIYRGLVEEVPDEFDGRLAAALHQKAYTLGALDRYNEAIESILEAITLRSKIQAADPASYEFARNLADSYHEYAICLSSTGDVEAAVDYGRRAAGLWRELASRNSDPDTFYGDLSLSLYNLAIDLANLKRYQEAVTEIVDSIQMRRRLAANDPAVYDPLLALSLVNHALYLHQLGRTADAVVPAQEAVNIWQGLAGQDSLEHNGNYALAMHNLADYLHILERSKEAIPLNAQAVDIRRRIVDHQCFALDSAHDFVDSLRQYAACLEACGLGGDAAGLRQEILDVLHIMAEKDPKRFGPELEQTRLQFS